MKKVYTSSNGNVLTFAVEPVCSGQWNIVYGINEDLRVLNEKPWKSYKMACFYVEQLFSDTVTCLERGL